MVRMRLLKSADQVVHSRKIDDGVSTAGAADVAVDATEAFPRPLDAGHTIKEDEDKISVG